MLTTPQPTDFFSEAPPPRIIGTENECTLQLAEGKSPSEYITIEAMRAAGYEAAGRFLDNGTKLYVDLGHLEIDSAESLGPRQAAAADFAGLVTLTKIVEASGVEHKGLHCHTGTIIGARERTSGRHENYMFPRSITEDPLIDTLMASFLTSAVWKMAGTVKQGFQLSQKANGISDPAITREVERRARQGDKPMAMIPPADEDQDTIGNPDWARFEVRYADGSFSRTNKFLGYAATSLGLRLVEHQDKVKLDNLKNLSFKRHAATTTFFNHDLSFSAVADTADGRLISAVDFQEAMVCAAAELAGKIELPQDEQVAIGLWQEVCDQLRSADLANGHYGKLLTMLDFAPRHRYLTTRFTKKSLHSRNPKAVEANLTWDRILPKGGGMTYWANMPSPYVSSEEIALLTEVPPLTRASMRGNLIAHYAEDITSVNWASVTFRQARTPLPDSYKTVV